MHIYIGEVYVYILDLLMICILVVLEMLLADGNKALNSNVPYIGLAYNQSERERKLRVGLASLNAVAAQLSHLRLAPLTGDRFGRNEGCVENIRSKIMFFSSFFRPSNKST